MKMGKIAFGFVLIGLGATGFAASAEKDGSAYDIGEAMEEKAFWTGDPVLFVSRHAENGFQFTSDERTGADSRQEGGVAFHGTPVYETRVAFAEGGGVERVEMMLYSTGGTEKFESFQDEQGRRFRRRVRVETKPLAREDFIALLKGVRGQLTAEGAKAPAAVRETMKDATSRQFAQTWPKTAVPTQARLTWNYEQEGRKVETFKAGFVRLTVNGPTALAGAAKGRGAAAGRGGATAKGAKNIAANVVKDPRGDVFIDGMPMVDQGQKGYCAVATAERVMRYFGLEVDEHEVAQAAGTSAEGGTSTRAMKDAVAAIGKKFRLATVVCYGTFDKGTTERIEGLANEVKAYNKAAKRLKKEPITESVYVSRRGNMVTYSPSAVDEAMDAEVLKEMKVNGTQKPKYTKFLSDVRQQVAKGIPLFWGVKLGVYPEPGLPQKGGYHIRLIVGYNDKKKEILYSDSWGAGHELKRMPADWAWTISTCLMYMKPLNAR